LSHFTFCVFRNLYMSKIYLFTSYSSIVSSTVVTTRQNKLHWVLLLCEWCFLVVVVVEFLSQNSTNQPTNTKTTK
jgi:hypothetical protein